MDAGWGIIFAAIAISAVVAAFLLLRQSERRPRRLRGTPGALPRVKVEHVIDGDTVIVSQSLDEVRLRLYSIDCPESGQPWGSTATAGLVKLIGGRYVHMEQHGVDKHGRTLATIYVRDRDDSEWINVNERMVTLGHAWVMRKYYDRLPKRRKDQLNRLERWARSKRVGLWRTPNPMPPWRWRNQHNYKADGGPEYPS